MCHVDQTQISPRVQKVNPMQTAIISCYSTNHPLWTHNGKQISTTNVQINENGNLMILKASIDNQGLHKCQGTRNGKMLHALSLLVIKRMLISISV